jgi:pyruvate,water dikinase
VRGIPASIGIISGEVKIVHRPQNSEDFPEGAILVTELITPAYTPFIQKAAAVVTDTGGVTTHAAILAREFGIPCIVGTTDATHILKDQQLVTVDAIHGVIYKGKVPSQAVHETHRSIPLGKERSTHDWITGTKLYVNIADPEQAKQAALLAIDGVGLIRAEFLISQLGEHPKALLERGQADHFIHHLTSGLEVIAKAFHPRPVIYRTSDFKSNEYRQLKEGDRFEPDEQNPALGYRGVARYLDDPALFRLELQAVKKLRQDHNLTNIHIIFPFVRTIQEMTKLFEILEEVDMKPSRDFKVWMMVEVPSNVFLIEQFCQTGIQGISIGSNDLTQLILGVDRDNGKLNGYFDERDPAVLTAIRQVIRATRKFGLTSSICGSSTSIHPEIVSELIKAGITSISVVPDVAEQTRRLIASVERKILLEKALN